MLLLVLVSLTLYFSSLLKLYLIYNRSDCAILPQRGIVNARELATLNVPSKVN